MTADIVTTLQQLLWASPALLLFLAAARRTPLPDDDEPVLLFRSEGFAEDLGETYPSI